MSARIRSSSSLSAVFRHAARKPSIRCPRARFNSTYEYPEEEIARREATRKATRNAAIALALIGAAGGLYYYESTGGTIPNPVPDSTFTVSHTYRNGKKRDFIFKWLPDSVLDGMMHEHEDSQVIDRPGNPVTRWDRNWIGSNEPCEDRSAIDLLPRNRGITPLRGVIGEKDLMLFSVIDGHGGWATSDLLEKTMHPTLALGLAGLQAGIIPGEGTWQRLAKSINPMAWGGSAWTPENIMHSLQASALQLDDNIVYSPFKYLAGLPKGSSDDARLDANAPNPHPVKLFLAMAKPADNGAVALSMLVDAENDDLYVSSTGDCRAVAGWQHADGSWRCDALSEDKDGDNATEVARMQAEHPVSERDTVIRSGRVLGGLQPTRAFGDSSYKWTSKQAAALKQVFDREGEKFRVSRPNYLTPPYVTARPELEHRKLHGKNGEKLKFVIIATDGLWGELSSEEATLLVAKYLETPKTNDIPKKELPKQLGFVPPAEPRLHKADDLPGTGSKASGAWVFEGDKNAATHLIRNAFGAHDRKFHRQLLSMRGEDTRRWRDDITVQVVFF